MRDGFIRVSAVTPKIRVADPVYNCEAVLERLREEWEKGTKICVFPELVLTAYTCNDLFHQNILPPDAIREAMEKQMKAEREKREVVTLAQGKKESAVLTAQGNKEAAILNAEAEKQTAILHAEAEKERRIREAEGQAQAIRAVKEAEAEGIRMLKEAGADESVIRLRSLDTLAKVAEGESTKILIPSDIQNMAGLLTSLKESVK